MFHISYCNNVSVIVPKLYDKIKLFDTKYSIMQYRKYLYSCYMLPLLMYCCFIKFY